MNLKGKSGLILVFAIEIPLLLQMKVIIFIPTSFAYPPYKHNAHKYLHLYSYSLRALHTMDISLAHWAKCRLIEMGDIMQITKKRKVRSDKKENIKPTILLEVKTAITRLAYITDTPVKDIGEYLCKEALKSNEIMGAIAKHLKRDIIIDDTLYRGIRKDTSINRRTDAGECERITIRVPIEVNDLIEDLAYSLGCFKARACAVLIEHAINDYGIVDDFVRGFLEDGLDKHKMRELKKLKKFINDNDSNSEFTWASLLSVIIDEVNSPLDNPEKVVEEYLINNWRDH